MPDVHASVYRTDARAVIRENVAGQILRDPAFVQYDTEPDAAVESIPVKMNEEKMGLFPVWFLACKSKDGSIVSYAAINGQTGKVAADIPIDLKKYLIGSVILAIPIVLILNILVSLTAPVALVVSMALCLLCAVLLSAEKDRLYTKENRLNDAGLQYKNNNGKGSQASKTVKSGSSGRNKSTRLIAGVVAGVLILGATYGLDGILELLFDTSYGGMVLLLIVIIIAILLVSRLFSGGSGVRGKTTEKAPFDLKKFTWIRAGVALAAGLAIMIISPFEDTIYYAADIAMMIVVAWTILDIIKAHNELTTHKPVQLESRGGDEYEG